MDVVNLHKFGIQNVVANLGTAMTERQIDLVWKFFKKPTICLDGDGSFLMHLGSIKTLGTFANKNLKYILLNNNTHDSVGGQSTYTKNIN